MENEGIKIIGFTDSVNECECCGKTGLKGTFCVTIEGEERYYGSTCAHKKHGFDKKQVAAYVKTYDDKLENAENMACRILTRKFGTNKYSQAHWLGIVAQLMQTNGRAEFIQKVKEIKTQ